MNSLIINQASTIDPDVYKISVVILIIIMVMLFVLNIIRMFFEQKLKNKIIEKGVSDDSILSLLQSNSKNEKHKSVKWFIVLLGAGIGLFIVNKNLPLGIYSIGVLVVSISLSFLVYAMYLQRFGK